MVKAKNKQDVNRKNRISRFLWLGIASVVALLFFGSFWQVLTKEITQYLAS
jgi:hypothetical protein